MSKQKHVWLFVAMIIIGFILVIQHQPDAVQISYFVSSAWTNSHKQLTLYNNGSVVFEEFYNKNKTIKSIKLSDKEMHEIRTLTVKSNVFDYKDKYGCKVDCPTDFPSSSVKFIINGNEKIVSMYAPQNMPESLSQILEKLRDIEKKIK